MKKPLQIDGLDVLFDLLPDLLCLLDQQGRFLKVNKFLSRVLGYTELELRLSDFLTYIHPEDKESTLKQLQILAGNEKAMQFKNRFRCANGLYKSFSWNAKQLRDGTLYASARDITHYLKVQSQLTKAITDNQKIYNNSLDVLCSFDAEGRFTKVSKASEKVWGYKEDELLGKHSFDFFHPDDIETTANIKRNIKLGNAVTNFENRFIHKNGSSVPMVWSAQWIPAEQAMFATAHDASEREKQKEQLLFNERRLEALIESGNDLIGIINTDGIYLYVSSSVQKTLHMAPEVFVGKTPFDFIHPDDLNRLKNAFEYILTTEETVHIPPFRMISGNGSWCWIETYATNKTNDPAIGGVVVNSRDVSIKIKDEEEKRLAAEKLELSNERYKFVTEATNSVIWDWNLETNELSREKLFEKNFGHQGRLKIVNQNPWEDYLHPDDRERVINSINQTINNFDEKFWREEYRFIKADGTFAFVTDQGYIVRNADKKAVRMVGAMYDNTELKEKELRILKQNEQLREIAQINSHVIRRPVATILGLMDILDKNCVHGKGNLEILEYLETTTQELDMVIRRINDWTMK